MTGTGMHSGQPAAVAVQPAPAGAGVCFLSGGTILPARAEHVANTRRATCLAVGPARVDTVEHILSALHGLGIDNVEIEIDGPELPILDGSALPWVEALLDAGIVELGDDVVPIRPASSLALRDGDSWMVATPADDFSLTCVTHFDHPLLGTQSATFVADPALFAAEIAPARTFGFAAEVEALRAAGLAKGGSLDNALVIYDDRFSDELRVPDECLRHKLLDLWGDLYLAGGRIQAAVTAIKPGHKINAAFARMIAEAAR
jgi:UDP-3-O-[3-hydroxymyristoyl] N-acetylglucosamine deacetylase